MDWRLIQGVPRLSPCGSWDRLQPPPTDPELDKGGIENGWMDICTLLADCFINFELNNSLKMLCCSMKLFCDYVMDKFKVEPSFFVTIQHIL